jgi:hypothetical protein
MCRDKCQAAAGETEKTDGGETATGSEGRKASDDQQQKLNHPIEKDPVLEGSLPAADGNDQPASSLGSYEEMIGGDTPLTDDGYDFAMSHNDTTELSNFKTRLIESMGGRGPEAPADLAGKLLNAPWSLEELTLEQQMVQTARDAVNITFKDLQGQTMTKNQQNDGKNMHPYVPDEKPEEKQNIVDATHTHFPLSVEGDRAGVPDINAVGLDKRPACSEVNTDRFHLEYGGCCTGLMECVEARPSNRGYCSIEDPNHNISCWSTIRMCRSKCNESETTKGNASMNILKGKSESATGKQLDVQDGKPEEKPQSVEGDSAAVSDTNASQLEKGPVCSGNNTDRNFPRYGGCCTGLVECVEPRPSNRGYCGSDDPNHNISCWSTIRMCRDRCHVITNDGNDVKNLRHHPLSNVSRDEKVKVGEHVKIQGVRPDVNGREGE